MDNDSHYEELEDFINITIKYTDSFDISNILKVLKEIAFQNYIIFKKLEKMDDKS